MGSGNPMGIPLAKWQERRECNFIPVSKWTYHPLYSASALAECVNGKQGQGSVSVEKLGRPYGVTMTPKCSSVYLAGHDVIGRTLPASHTALSL